MKNQSYTIKTKRKLQYYKSMTIGKNSIIVHGSSLYLLASLAKKNCRMCYGRGFLNLSNPDGIESQVVCKCAEKGFLRIGNT